MPFKWDQGGDDPEEQGPRDTMCPCPRPARETVTTISADWTLVLSFPEEGRGGEEGGKGRERGGQGRGRDCAPGEHGRARSLLCEDAMLPLGPASCSHHPLHTSFQSSGLRNLQDPILLTFLTTNSSLGLLGLSLVLGN